MSLRFMRVADWAAIMLGRTLPTLQSAAPQRLRASPPGRDRHHIPSRFRLGLSSCYAQKVGLFALTLCIVLCAQTVHGSHFRYGSINWRIPDPANAPRTVEFTVTTAWRSDFLDEPSPFRFGDNTMISLSQGTEISAAGDLSGESFKILRNTFSHTYLGTKQDFEAGFGNCCRIHNLKNASGGDFELNAKISLTPGNTSGPKSAAPVILEFPVDTLSQFILPINDPDHDHLACRISSFTESGIPTPPQIPQPAGPPAQPEFPPNGDCTLAWNTTGGVVGDKYAVQILVESTLNGSLSTTPVDFILELVTVTTSPPTCDADPNTPGEQQNFSITAFGNNPISHMVTGTDSNKPPRDLTFNVVDLPPDATTQVAVPSPGVTNVQFDWTPGSADSGGVRIIQFSFSNPVSSSCFLTVDVLADGDSDGVSDFDFDEDSNQDGICSLNNEDIDGDGKLDLNEDLDSDGNLDFFEDTNGNGQLDDGEDIDGDGRLDLIIEDVDGDGNLDRSEDINGNGILDFKEDLNGDGICSVIPGDNCLEVPNPDQLDTDGDSQGNACDTDDDNDGLLDSEEANTGTDPLSLDSDGDNWDDGTEVGFGTDPTDPASSPDANTAKLLAPDGASRDEFGSSVDVSSTGDTAIIGAPLDDTTAGTDAGSARVFTRDPNGLWTQQAQLFDPDGTSGARFGRAVALSSRGDTAIVGIPDADTEAGSNAGSALVFSRDPNGLWTQQAQLLDPDGAEFDDFGFSVALSSSGDTAIVGARFDDTEAGSNAGSALVFSRDPNGLWTPQPKLLNPNGTAGARFGSAVALSSTGDTAIVGAPEDQTNLGSAHLFIRGANGLWTPQVQLLNLVDGTNAAFGASVALSSTGDTAIVGSPDGTTDRGFRAGFANVYTRRADGSWRSEGRLFHPEGAPQDNFGSSVALSDTGDTAIVGADGDNTAGGPNDEGNGGHGSTHVFTRDANGLWTPQQQFVAPDGEDFEFFGNSVALSSQAGTAVVGASGDNTAGGFNAGSAYVFDINRQPTGAVTIDGLPEQGATLTANTSTLADEDGLGAFSYQWLRNQEGSATIEIPEATGSAYVLTQADVGASIAVTVSYTDGGNTKESLRSALTSRVAFLDTDTDGIPDDMSLPNGRFAETENPLVLSAMPRALRPRQTTAFDVDSDGDVDLITFFQSDQLGNLNFFLNRGDGTFQRYSYSSGNNAGILRYPITVGDINGDGAADILSGNGAILGNFENQVTLASPGYQLGDPSTFIINPFSPSVPDYTGLVASAFLDFDQDGRSDLAAVARRGFGADATHSLIVLIRNESGTLELASETPVALIGIDENSDGIDDNGEFFSVVSGSASLSVGDINLDGAADVLIGTRLQGPISPSPSDGAAGAIITLLGDANGGFQPPIYTRCVACGFQIDLINVNDDGNPDLLFATLGNTNANVIAIGQGDGTFDGAFDVTLFGITEPVFSVPEIAGQYGPGFVKPSIGACDGTYGLGDVTGDGVRDLVTPPLGSPLRPSQPSAFFRSFLKAGPRRTLQSSSQRQTSASPAIELAGRT